MTQAVPLKKNPTPMETVGQVFAVIRTGAHSIVTRQGKLVKLDRGSISNASQEILERFLTATLNGLIERREHMKESVLTSSFYLDPTGSRGYTAFTVLQLNGGGITSEEIEYFRAAVAILSSEVIGQPSLFAATQKLASLDREDEDYLRDEALKFLQKFGGQKIKKTVFIHLGFDDREGQAIKDSLPSIEATEVVNEVEEGFAKPDGYSISGNEIYLLRVKGHSVETRPVKLQGIHQSHFDTAAKASLERSTVKYTARRLKQGASKKEVLSLVSLDIIEPSPEDFSLT